MKTLTTILALLLCFASPAFAQADEHDHSSHAPPAQDSHADHAPSKLRTHAWDPELVERFATLPVQEGGRVKPLDTQVSFLLLRLNGARSVRVPDEQRFGAAAGTKLTPMEWGLDVLFYPEMAAQYPVFQVQTSDVVHAIGLGTEGKKKRDRYSYAELQVGEEKLMELTQRYSSIDEKNRTALQGQIVALGFNSFHYRLFSESLGFANLRVAIRDPVMQARIGGENSLSLSGLLSHASDFERAVDELHAIAEPTQEERAELSALENLRFSAVRMVGDGRFIAWFPPHDAAVEAWLTLPELVQQVLLEPAPGADLSAQVSAVAALERLSELRDDPAAFAAEAASLHATISELAATRGEYDGIEMEVALYRADPFYRSLILYLLGFVVVAFAWLRPASRWPWKLVSVLTVAGTLVLVAGIVVRCVLRGRPPVTTLYETVLFVTATVVITTLVIEWINRKRVAVSLGALLGAGGMFLAGSYERMDGQDTMPTLIAVLDTNFWLSTHVTTVTMGYAAGLLAGGIAHVYLLGKLFGLRKRDPTFYRNLARMVYGVVCFTVLFSVVGTILGGVWANESWGRFWGWDPKENGALMIVLWNLAILHGRMSGLIRDFGLCLMAVFGNIVVAFSWWGVNLLGVGLHSYGFTAGVQKTLYTFYAIEAGVVLLGTLAYLLNSRMEARTES